MCPWPRNSAHTSDMIIVLPKILPDTARERVEGKGSAFFFFLSRWHASRTLTDENRQVIIPKLCLNWCFDQTQSCRQRTWHVSFCVASVQLGLVALTSDGIQEWHTLRRYNSGGFSRLASERLQNKTYLWSTNSFLYRKLISRAGPFAPPNTEVFRL